MSRKASRRKRRRHHRLPPGTAPGTINVDPEAPRPRLSAIAYGPAGVEELALDSPAAIPRLLERWPITWVNVAGLGDAATLGQIREIFKIHPLAIEDVVNVHQRAKIEQYGDQLFFVARTIELHEGEVETDQLSIFIGPRFVVTFQETAADPFDPLRERLRKGSGRIRERGPDYLAYALIDAVVDAYFPVIEAYGERLEALDQEVLDSPSTRVLRRTQALRRDLLTVRRAVFPLREAVSTLLREPCPLISDETRIYLRDCHDHTFQVIDLTETYRESAAVLTETYLSSLGQRTNEVMKVLTMIATIFIPLTFIAGVYGMNFKTESSRWNMPELTWAWGYPACLALMAAIAIAMLVFFRRKGWLGGRTDPEASGADGGEPRSGPA
jgi:magnesium transporter